MARKYLNDAAIAAMALTASFGVAQAAAPTPRLLHRNSQLWSNGTPMALCPSGEG